MDWLTRADIDSAIEAMSADDVIEALATHGKAAGERIAKEVFNRAAARAGFGEEASTRVRATDFPYWGEHVGGVLSADSPLPADTAALLHSVAIGE